MLGAARGRIAVTLLSMFVLVACGGAGSDDDTASNAAEETSGVTLVDSGVGWLGERAADGELSEVDVSLVKGDPTVVGVELWWEFAADDPADDFFTIAASLEVTVDDVLARTRGTGQSITGSSQRRSVEGDLVVLPTDAGLRVLYRFTPLGASDLYDDDGEPIVLNRATIDVDFEEGDAEITGLDYLLDGGEDGLLDYTVTLVNDLDPQSPAATVSFRTIESDPSVEAVPDDPAVIAAIEAGDDATTAEASGCAVDVHALEGSTLTITAADGSAALVVDLPAGWVAEVDGPNDPCLARSVAITSAETESGDDLDVALEFRTPYFDSLAADAEDWQSNAIDMTFSPIEDLTLLGRPAVYLLGASSDPDSNFRTHEYWIDAGPRVVTMRFSDFGGTERRALFDELLAAMTLTVG